MLAQLLIAAVVGKQAAGHVGKRALVFTQLEVHAATPWAAAATGTELRQHQFAVVETVELDLHGLADPHLARLDAHDLRNQPRALFQLHQNDRVGVVERWHLGVVHDDERIHGAAPRSFHGVPFKRMAAGHTGPGGWRSRPQPLQRWISSLPAREPFPEKARVVADAGQRALGGHRGRRLVSRPV